ncbi:glycoside hydrolase family 16 protein [Zasmidium cellare ATCC 36951]|uniref:Glycoside hydrolase family 16 protein n=1 Tax=Zasmidium cellare ATCC 36951 TaxID=1080233 RepID=A0A6A6CES7_ZASCE|nr:glycoside hydrolase family 16 protein [Zasmidium cellare ATCC 36951]KAF2164432.1 glycoside hydrolase family 16 protein [Zasmidium cellare ATCC 36951]
MASLPVWLLSIPICCLPPGNANVYAVRNGGWALECAGSGAPGAAPYELVDDYQPGNFLDKFNFYSSYDPTYGHVQYVNETVATANGYAAISSRGTFVLKPDTTNAWPNGGLGIPSVRIISDNTYYHGLFVMDMVHMPTGCGTWPAYWLLGPEWPSKGEIDIIEGVHTDMYNTISMHTSDNCTIAGSTQSGTLKQNNCYAGVNGNSGCGSLLDNNAALPNNYGAGFNQNQGGVYVTEWTSEFVKHWWFPRGSIPSSITNGAPDISQFGIPAVNQQGACDIDTKFRNMSVIINIDFCGAWAGNVYRQYTNCPQNPNPSVDSLNSCVDYVGTNPDSLKQAYFEINSLRVLS